MALSGGQTTFMIREATDGDIPSIIAVRTAVRENHLSVEQLAELGITAQTIRDALRQEPCIWVAELDGRIIGFSMADTTTACVFAAFVHPDHERQGIGRLLMDQVEAFLFKRHSSIWLETDASTRAVGFYLKLGWERMQTHTERGVRFEKRR